MAYILEDEMLEVTPSAIRMRKKVLSFLSPREQGTFPYKG